VCFDVGEVLVDETRVWSAWADVIGVPRFTFMAVMGACIAAGGDHTAAFERLGVADWETRIDDVHDAFGGIQAADLYPDVIPTLGALSEAGYGVAVIGNQPERREPELRAAGVNPDVMVMSDTLGVQKPAPQFFAAVLDRLQAEPSDVAYVGDRVDDDVIPAAAAGMFAVWLRRGPWAWLNQPPEDTTALVATSLDDLAALLSEAWPP